MREFKNGIIKPTLSISKNIANKDKIKKYTFYCNLFFKIDFNLVNVLKIIIWNILLN